MSPMAQLSPIDPSLEHPLGPTVQMPGQPPRGVPVNVEDVSAFSSLGKEMGLSEEESMRRIFEKLADQVHPMVLGAVHRSREQITFLATQLMKYHTDDDKKIETVVSVLTRERFSHDYLIGRREAREMLGLKVIEPNPALAGLMTDLFNGYSEYLELTAPFNPETVLGQKDEDQFQFDRSVIESTESTHVFRTEKKISRVKFQTPEMPIPQIAYQEIVLREGWIEEA